MVINGGFLTAVPPSQNALYIWSDDVLNTGIKSQSESFLATHTQAANKPRLTTTFLLKSLLSDATRQADPTHFTMPDKLFLMADPIILLVCGVATEAAMRLEWSRSKMARSMARMGLMCVSHNWDWAKSLKRYRFQRWWTWGCPALHI